MGKEKRKKIEPPKISPYRIIIFLFLNHLESMKIAFPDVLKVVNRNINKCEKNLQTFLKTKTKPHKSNKDKKKSFQIDIENYREFVKLIESKQKAELAEKTILQSSITSLVSIYDSFLGQLIKVMLENKSEILNSTDKNIPFNKILEFNTINDAKDFIIEKEVESVLRTSHSDQIKWLENKLGIPLKKELDIWPSFIELTERRNLYTHSNGVVSSQYLSVCSSNLVTFEKKFKVGDELKATIDYFNNAYKILLEMGVKLNQVIWHKLHPDNLEEADNTLIEIGYNILYAEDYELTKIILEFSTNVLKKYSDEMVRRVFIVNKALAYKWSGEDKKAKEIIKAEDWSICNDNLKLAEAVILDNYTEATQIMRVIGSRGRIGKSEYMEWPLFKEFRKSKEFLNAFEEIFKEPSITVEDEKLKEKVA
ncbi:MAG: hypothetical protein IPJ03_19380 [Ignavibacteriales bacterium]|nr:hypothetical protein [Ignavibacteriales bacterium]